MICQQISEKSINTIKLLTNGRVKMRQWSFSDNKLECYNTHNALGWGGFPRTKTNKYCQFVKKKLGMQVSGVVFTAFQGCS